jgi:hypothetical protein
MGLSRAESREMVKRATGDIILPVVLRPFSFVVHFVVWGGRKIINLTSGIKELIFGVKHPVLSGLGQIIDISGIAETHKWIATAARIVCVIRPFIKLSEAGREIKQSAKELATCLFEDTSVARAYGRARGTLNGFSATWFGFLINNRVPMFANRLGKVIADIFYVTVYSCDMFEALTAKKKDLVHRSLAELKETVDQVGRKELFRTIDFHAAWINEILHKFNSNMDISGLKKIINISSDLKDKSEKAVVGAIDIAVNGILGAG